MGGTGWEDPQYPGILCIPDTADLRGMVRGGTSWEDPLGY